MSEISLNNTKCKCCNRKKGMSLKCKYCEKNFCTACILPEKHQCSNQQDVKKMSKQELENQLFKNAHRKRKLECI